MKQSVFAPTKTTWRKVFGKNFPKHEIKTYDKLDYVDYVKGAPVLKMWFEHHLGKPFIPNIRAALMDVQGMTRIITSGLGAGVLPLRYQPQSRTK